jgi:hypothetical protein
MNYIEKARKMYEKGFSIRKISKKFGIPRETLRIRLINSGVKMRKSKRDMVEFLHEPNFEINPISAELLALHAGDGSLDVRGSWCFSSNKNDKNLVKMLLINFKRLLV